MKHKKRYKHKYMRLTPFGFVSCLYAWNRVKDWLYCKKAANL